MVWAKEGSRNWVPTPNWTPAVGIPVGRDFTLGRPQPAQDPSTVHHHAWSPSEEPRGRKTPGSEDPTPNPNRFQIVRSAVVTQVREIRALRLLVPLERRDHAWKESNQKNHHPLWWSRRRRSLFTRSDTIALDPDDQLVVPASTPSSSKQSVSARRSDKPPGPLS